MPHPRSATTKVAILGTDTLAEGILVRLLQKEGYATTILEAHPAMAADGLLEGVDLLLLTPSLAPGLREAFLEDMRCNPKTAHIPTLSFSATLKLALVDEQAVSASWQSLFEELTSQIGATLTRAAASARALVVDCGEPAAQADAL
jgi:hypothetical protein